MIGGRLWWRVQQQTMIEDHENISFWQANARYHHTFTSLSDNLPAPVPTTVSWGARCFASGASEYFTLLFSDRFFEFQRFFTSLSERPGISVRGEHERIEYN
jgi:hypothetical protein